MSGTCVSYCSAGFRIRPGQPCDSSPSRRGVSGTIAVKLFRSACLEATPRRCRGGAPLYESNFGVPKNYLKGGLALVWVFTFGVQASILSPFQEFVRKRSRLYRERIKRPTESLKAKLAAKKQRLDDAAVPTFLTGRFAASREQLSPRRTSHVNLCWRGVA